MISCTGEMFIIFKKKPKKRLIWVFSFYHSSILLVGSHNSLMRLGRHFNKWIISNLWIKIKQSFLSFKPRGSFFFSFWFLKKNLVSKSRQFFSKILTILSKFKTKGSFKNNCHHGAKKLTKNNQCFKPQQNAIKNCFWASLKLETLDSLMRVSF